MVLAHEFAQLANAVIFIGANDDHQMIRSVLPDVSGTRAIMTKEYPSGRMTARAIYISGDITRTPRD
jgi:hypothetical protein